MNDRLYADIHVIETLPPSCVNRDDLGSPKTAFYGGVTRARVSSQAWKRAVRLEFMRKKENTGERTKHTLDLVAKEIENLDSAIENPDELAKEALKNAFASKKNKKEKETEELKLDVLVFISKEQVKALAQTAVSYKDKNKKDKGIAKEFKADCKAALKSKPSIDIALFGRMIANDDSLNYDAAAQVAHAISTHEVHNEYDYFTAVDDQQPADDSGAGHVGTTEFNSSTMYRYATVNVLELAKNLDEDVPHVVRAFMEAFVRTMPTGKQNSFANRVRPDAVYITVRRDQPVNMAGAFEKPVQAGKNGYVEGSVQRLIDYAKETYQDYYDAPSLELVVGSGMDAVGEKMPLSAMLDKLEEYLTKALVEEESR